MEQQFSGGHWHGRRAGRRDGVIGLPFRTN
jgi:hypothetical protein